MATVYQIRLTAPPFLGVSINMFHYLCCSVLCGFIISNVCTTSTIDSRRGMSRDLLAISGSKHRTQTAAYMLYIIYIVKYLKSALMWRDIPIRQKNAQQCFWWLLLYVDIELFYM